MNTKIKKITVNDALTLLTDDDPLIIYLDDWCDCIWRDTAETYESTAWKEFLEKYGDYKIRYISTEKSNNSVFSNPYITFLI